MKTMRLWIIALMLLVSLCGCSSNQVPTSEVSATSSNVSENDSDISLSYGETTSELTTSEATSSEPTTSPKEKSTTQSTASQKGTEKPTTTNSSSGNQSENKITTSREQENPASSKPEEKPKSAFSKPYDISTMKKELLEYGTSIGMSHITEFSADFGGGEITPYETDRVNFLPPHETWLYSSADKLKQDLCSRVKRWKDNGESTYTLWFEKDSKHSGEYIIYVIIG